MAFQIQSRLLIRWTVREGNVVVSNLIPELDLFLLQQQSGGDGVDGCVAPSFIEEATVLVERAEIVDVLLGPQPIQTSNFEVRPL